MHTAPCPVPIASYFLTQAETVTPPYCQTGQQWDPKQSGAEQFPIAGNSSAPAKPHYDLESRFGLIIRNKCRSTPVLGELDTALLLPENNKPALSLGSQSWEEIRERERRAETSSLDLLTSEPSAEAEQCVKPTHFFLNRHEAVLLQTGKGSTPRLQSGNPVLPFPPGSPETRSAQQ